jgi:hypothetical protein
MDFFQRCLVVLGGGDLGLYEVLGLRLSRVLADHSPLRSARLANRQVERAHGEGGQHGLDTSREGPIPPLLAWILTCFQKL